MSAAGVSEGGCFCGAIRYRAVERPIGVTHCHCTQCRRHGGGAFQTWVSFEGGVTFTKGAPRVYRSSDRAERGHCPTCGTPLIFRYVDQAPRISVSVGSLDTPETVVATRHYWTSETLPWLRLDDYLPRRRRQ